MEKYADPGTALAAVLGDGLWRAIFTKYQMHWRHGHLFTPTPSPIDAAFILPEMRKLNAFLQC